MLAGRSSLYTLHMHFTCASLTGCLTMHCCAAEEACALEACYVAAFRMKQRGLVLHEKLDKAAVSSCCCCCAAVVVGVHVVSAWQLLFRAGAAWEAGQGGGELMLSAKAAVHLCHTALVWSWEGRAAPCQ